MIRKRESQKGTGVFAKSWLGARLLVNSETATTEYYEKLFRPLHLHLKASKDPHKPAAPSARRGLYRNRAIHDNFAHRHARRLPHFPCTVAQGSKILDSCRVQ